MAQLALASVPGAHGVTLLPYFDGERTPNLPGATGSLLGLTRANATPENLARAVVEGMLLNVAAGVDALRSHGVHIGRVLVIGGAAASRAVREIAPLLMGAPVEIPAPGEYVGLGAARQAAWALAGPGGELPAWQVASVSHAEAVTDERAEAAIERYREAVRHLHGVG